MRQKLSAKKYPQSDIDIALAYAEAEGWLNDAHFAAVYTRMRIQRGYGRLRVQAELHERGIDASVITHVLNEHTELEQQQLALLIAKKCAGHIATTPALRAKQIRFLLQRGFSFEQIKQAEAGDIESVDF